MANQFEKNTIRLSFFIGIVSFFYLIRKPPLKDWLLIFLLKGYIASIVDNILVKRGYLKYPVRLFKSFDISILFSYLIFPVMCIYFNQVTKKSNILGILTKCFIFTFPTVVAELWLEKNTKLITYKKSWTGIHSFISIASTFLIVRFLITLIRKSAEKQSG